MLRPPVPGLHLDLDGTSLDDSMMTHIDKLPVTILNLGRAKVTDVGLSKLANMPSLWQLDVTGTAVTPAGVAALKQRIPSLRTVHTNFDRDRN
jgi:hypothetical protein